jgi:ligand-binding sensor domain-containing protein
MTEDSQHNIWAEVSGSNRELIRIRNLMVVDEFPEKLVPSARALAADLQNGIWLGLRSGDLARFRNGHLDVFSIPHSVNSPIRQVLVNSDGSVFGATTYGLVGWRNGQSQVVKSRNGLLCDGIIGMNWDNHGDLWLYTECGLLRIEKADVQRWKRPPLPRRKA